MILETIFVPKNQHTMLKHKEDGKKEILGKETEKVVK
jgi:hypothetical protein